MHPGLIISDRDGTVVDSESGANTAWLDATAE
jgi:beta-phosphoglucomutase-like phosphatase (HAD superfamily)